MSLDRMEVNRLRIASAETAFATDMTSDVGSNFDDLRVKPTTVVRDTQMAVDETIVQRFFQQRDPVQGPKRGSCPVEGYWTSTNEALTNGVTPTKRGQSKLFEAIMGGYAADEGSLATGTPTTTVIDVTATQGSRFPEGSIAGFVVSGVIYPRLVATRSTDQLTVWPALPSAPAAASIVYNTQLNYLDESDDASVQVLFESAIDRGDIWLMRGCQGDLGLNMPLNGLLSWTTSLRGAVVEHDDEITTPQGGSAIAAASYSDSAPLWGSKGGVHFGPAGATTLSMVRVSNITFNTGIAFIDVPDHNGTEGVGDMERDRQETTYELTILKNAGDGTHELYHDAFVAGTEYGLLAWFGDTAGGIRVLCAPTGVISKAPEAVDFNGFRAIKVTVLVKENGHSTDYSTTIRRSRFYLAAM